jgi:hypothetical protein
MLQQLFQIGQSNTSVNVALANANSPAEIVRACMNQLIALSQKKDKELRDLLQVRA